MPALGWRCEDWRICRDCHGMLAPGYAIRSAPFLCRNRPLEPIVHWEPPPAPVNADHPSWQGRDFNSNVIARWKLQINQTFNLIMDEGVVPNLRLRFVNHHDEPLLIAHFQGYSMSRHYPAAAAFARAQISLPPEVTIVTFATANILGEALLLHQLDAAGIPYLNIAREVPPEDWENPVKPGLLAEHLARVTTEYALVLDSLDVLFCGPLDDLLNRYRTHYSDKRVLFGATKRPHPKMVIETLDRSGFGAFRHLNAGTSFGRVADLLRFYRRAAEVFATVERDETFHSEQRLVRMIFAEDTESVGFDHRCSIFQTFGRTEIEQSGDVVKVS